MNRKLKKKLIQVRHKAFQDAKKGNRQSYHSQSIQDKDIFQQDDVRKRTLSKGSHKSE